MASSSSSYIFKQFEVLEAKLKEEVGIQWDGVAGQFSGMICPKCRGGRTRELSFSLFISEDGKVAKWKCHRAKCGWTGRIQDGKVHTQGIKGKQSRVITEKELQLEPLSEEVLMYKGKEALKELIETAEFYPIKGLYRFSSFFSEIDEYYHCKNGNE